MKAVKNECGNEDFVLENLCFQSKASDVDRPSDGLLIECGG